MKTCRLYKIHMPSEKKFQTAFVCHAHDAALFSQSQSYLRLLPVVCAPHFCGVIVSQACIKHTGRLKAFRRPVFILHTLYCAP